MANGNSSLRYARAQKILEGRPLPSGNHMRLSDDREPRGGKKSSRTAHRIWKETRA